MRQVGTLTNESQAQRFVDYLTTQDIDARADEDTDGWVIWVMDEERVQKALTEFKDFRSNPDDARYADVSGAAERRRRERLQRQQAAAKNVVEMRGSWNRGMTRKAPAMFALMAVTILAGLLSDFDANQNEKEVVRWLSFRNPVTFMTVPTSQDNPFYDIERGEVWRLVTPIFLHVGIWHIVANMYWFWVFGSQIESRRGWWRFLVLVFLTALIPNVFQAVIAGPWFAGMSGVGFGLFGYAWMKSRFDPKLGIFVSQLQSLFFMGWFVICFTGFVGPIANAAHAGGLFVGVVIGYLPELIPALRKWL